MHVRLRHLLAVSVSASMVLAMGACSSSSGKSKSAAPSSTTGASSSQSGSGSGAVDAAQAYIAPYLKAPTSIGVTDKLTKKPGAGKKMVFITCENPTCTDFYTGFADAAKQFGWSVQELIAPLTDPASNNRQMLQAISLKADAITITGGNVPTWQHALDAAKAANIPVFGTSMESYPVGASTGIYATIPVNSDNRTIAGKITGNWIVADSGGKANVLNVNIPELKIPFFPYAQTVDATVNQACSGSCSSAILQVPAADAFSGKLPGEVVSYLQSHPKVKYVNLAGGFETGVSAALKQAGLQSVKLIAPTSNQAVENGVKTGEYSVALGFDSLVIGWYVVNAIARHLSGLEPGDSAKPPLPTQLLTKDNVGSPQDFQQPSDYKQQFRTLWGL